MTKRQKEQTEKFRKGLASFIKQRHTPSSEGGFTAIFTMGELQAHMDEQCEECGGMGHTIGFLGKKKIKHPCETCSQEAKS